MDRTSHTVYQTIVYPASTGVGSSQPLRSDSYCASSVPSVAVLVSSDKALTREGAFIPYKVVITILSAAELADAGCHAADSGTDEQLDVDIEHGLQDPEASEGHAPDSVVTPAPTDH
jgi:hypothetical protein